MAVPGAKGQIVKGWSVVLAWEALIVLLQVAEVMHS